HHKYRLDHLLGHKAEQGVKFHVMVYEEVTQAMSMPSKHTTSALEALHPNIVCWGHLDHIGSKHMVEFWSHHSSM
ncbi:hypothetical protein B0H12DRAFT_969052, partial [Mycena haematopus]